MFLCTGTRQIEKPNSDVPCSSLSQSFSARPPTFRILNSHLFLHRCLFKWDSFITHYWLKNVGQEGLGDGFVERVLAIYSVKSWLWLSSTPGKKLGTAAHTYNLSTGWGQREIHGSVGTCWPVSLTKLVNSGFCERSCLLREGGELRWLCHQFLCGQHAFK